MPRKCSICTHDKRDEIDLALTSSDSYRIIADRFGVSVTSLQRHKNHLSNTLVKATAIEDEIRADNLLQQVKYIQKKALSILSLAESTGDLRIACMAIRETRGTLELLAKVTGEMDDRPQVNIHLAPEWMTLRTCILGALDPFPEAQDALLRALSEVEPC